MLIITLARRTISYKKWYSLHRLMPVAYLILIFHAVVLTPTRLLERDWRLVAGHQYGHWDSRCWYSTAA